MPDNEPTRNIATRISIPQYEVLRDFLGDVSTSEYIRQLIAEDLMRHGIEWPNYTFVDNEQRRGKPLAWIDYDAR